MKGKLTPKESFVLYGVWIAVAFGLFLLGLYWGKGQTTGLRQEITTQPVEPAAAAVPQARVQTRLDEPAREAGPVSPDQKAPSPPAVSQVPNAVTAEVQRPTTSPGETGAPAKTPDTVSASRQGVFTIQVGALDTEEEARKVITRLQARGYTGILDKPVSQKDPFYRVRVGTYPTREDAARAEALLKDEGFLTFIKKVE